MRPGLRMNQALCSACQQVSSKRTLPMAGFPEDVLKGTDKYDLGSMELDKVMLANQALEEAASRIREPISLPRSSTDPFCRPAPAKTTTLKKIRLDELELDSCQPGRVLHGYLRGKALRFDRLAVTALQDETGLVARLMLQNTLETGTSAQELHFRYPDGAAVLVREPCLVRAALGIQGPALWVPNPASFELVCRFPNLDEEADELMQLADRELSAGNFAGAIELYSKCLERANGAQKKLAYARRAEASLMLGQNVRAVKDATASESLLTKARALVALRSYAAAAECLKPGLECSGDPSLRTIYDEYQRLYEQSLKGGIDISSAALTCSSQGIIKTYPDYVGPVQVRMTGDANKGRGLFTTADVVKGQLLLVQNTVVANGDDNGTGRCVRRSDFFTRVVTACLACPRTFAQARAMVEVDRVPCMDVFEPNWNLEMLLPELKLEAENAVFDISGMEWLVARAVSITHGIWTLPAFINHSCLPNVTTGGLGKAQYVYAARNMNAGTELVSSYWNVLKPWNSFRRNCPNNFVCSCPRCLLEERLQKPLNGICNKLDSVLESIGENNDEQSMSSFPVDPELAGIAVQVEKLLGELQLSHQEKQWLRTSFSKAYLHYYRNSVQAEAGVPMPEMESFMEGLLATVPGKALELMMKCTCSSRVKYDEAKARELLQQEAFLRYGEAGKQLF